MHFLPDSFVIFITYALFALGLGLYVASKLVTWIPLISQYKLPLELVGVVVLVCGAYLLGGWGTESTWRERVREAEAKVAQAEKLSAETNIQVITKLVTQTKIIHDKGQTIVDYIDREVVRNQEVIRFVENCPIPSVIISTHNAAALNQPVEEKK